jgi:hypothetical protein
MKESSKGKKVFRGSSVWGQRFWSRMYFPVLTVFEGQVEAWVSKLMGEVAEAWGAGLESGVEKVIEMELKRISEAIQRSKCTEVILINGGFVLDKTREYQIITVNEFLDKVNSLLQEGISRLRVQGDQGEGQREVKSVSEGSEGKSQIPPLEEFISQPLPIVGSYDVEDWMDEEIEAVASIVNPRYSPDDIISLIWDRDIERVEKKLRAAGSKYITIIEGSILDGILENKCQVKEIYDFLGETVEYIGERVWEKLSDEIW